MANIKSQKKRNKQNEVRRRRNQAVRSALKSGAKKAAAVSDPEEATAQQREVARELDRAVSKGILHKNTAARRKSRLAKASADTAASSAS
jgi:small subunit ribosomal protein S20